MAEEGLVYRRVERKRGDGWEEITFDLLKKGDLFKLYDPICEGQIEDGNTIYIAKSDAEVCHEPDGNYVIEADYA